MESLRGAWAGERALVRSLTETHTAEIATLREELRELRSKISEAPAGFLPQTPVPRKKGRACD
jgi:hypothetical protein